MTPISPYRWVEYYHVEEYIIVFSFALVLELMLKDAKGVSNE